MNWCGRKFLIFINNTTCEYMLQLITFNINGVNPVFKNKIGFSLIRWDLQQDRTDHSPRAGRHGQGLALAVPSRCGLAGTASVLSELKVGFRFFWGGKDVFCQQVVLQNCHKLRMALNPYKYWRRRAESNRSGRICNPLHNRFATAPK